MKIFKRFLKIFRHDWETIWTGEASGWQTRGGWRMERVDLICIVQIDRERKIFRAYATEGTVKREMDIEWLLAQSESLKKTMQENIQK